MECVVDTGMPIHAAACSQTAAARSAQTMPRRSTSGLPASASGLTMPFRTVSVTCEPASTAPANSQMPAAMTAHFMLIDLEPTASAIEFATSFAPMLQAM